MRENKPLCRVSSSNLFSPSLSWQTIGCIVNVRKLFKKSESVVFGRCAALLPPHKACRSEARAAAAAAAAARHTVQALSLRYHVL